MNTKEQIVSKLTEANNSELQLNRVHKAVAEFIKTQEGKLVDGWFERRAKKHFAEMGWSVRTYHIAGQTYLNISGGNSGYTLQNEARMFLGYDSDMDLTKFEDRNASSGSAAEHRILNRRSLLADELWINQAVCRIEAFQQSKKALETFMGVNGPSNEAYYIIRDLAGLVEKR